MAQVNVDVVFWAPEQRLGFKWRGCGDGVFRKGDMWVGSGDIGWNKKKKREEKGCVGRGNGV